MKLPCYQCRERKSLCHSECEKYKAWKQLREAAKKQLEEDAMSRRYLAEEAMKAKRRHKAR